MAARNKPSNGSKPDKILRDALILELNRLSDDKEKIKRLNRIAAKLVDAGEAGKIDAIQLIFDRVEGKAPQALAMTGEDGGPVQITWKSKG